VRDGGAGLNMAELVSGGALEAFFPLHDPAACGELHSKWVANLTSMPWNQPLWEVQTTIGRRGFPLSSVLRACGL
jgi:hypothetical protein